MCVCENVLCIVSGCLCVFGFVDVKYYVFPQTERKAEVTIRQLRTANEADRCEEVLAGNLKRWACKYEAAWTTYPLIELILRLTDSCKRAHSNCKP